MTVLQIIVVGAGLGGLGAAIALRLAGHEVLVLEAAHEIGEVGAGIQVLPNSSRTLFSWGLRDVLAQSASPTGKGRILGWKGGEITFIDFERAGEEYGSPFWDFHRADLMQALLDRALALGAKLEVNTEVKDIEFDDVKSEAIVTTQDQRTRRADLVIGADGINSRCREILLGRSEAPTRTGDMAYRLLLNGEDVRKDPELDFLFEDENTIYWYGPGAHIVTYPLRQNSLLNMVLLVPDNMPEEGPSTLQGYVDEMQGLFKDWDPRVGKLLAMCKSVLRWRLCIRTSIDSWVHPSGCFALLGDSAHATLPYLASGAGMSFEDGAVLGECLSRIKKASSEEKKQALQIYEKCRKLRTETVVQRGTIQQDLNHLDDGKEQEERDDKMRRFEKVEEEWQKGSRGPLPEGLKFGEDPLVWRRYGVGEWLLRYDSKTNVEELWPST